MSLNKKIRKLDMFKKVPTDLQAGTKLGGAMSLLTVGLIVFFAFYEFYLYFNQPERSYVANDERFTRKELIINIDIEFPKFPCEIISLDLQDVMMSHSPNIGSIQKYRLDSTGNYLDSDDFELLREPNQAKQLEMAELAFKNGYGCRLRGSFTVKEVPGNFHISSHAYQNLYVRLAMAGTIKTLDVSHKIHTLRFGDQEVVTNLVKTHPEAQLIPLDGHQRIYDMTQTPHSYTSHYHIDIVPTNYWGALGVAEAYQFTYNHNSYEVGHMPALYFNYHIGGTRVYVSTWKGFFGTFLLNVCAVIGGIYALGSFLNNLLHILVNDKSGYQELVQ